MSDNQGNETEGWFSRGRALTLVLVVVTCLAFYVCYLLALPFLPALAWGAALAIVAHPLHRGVERRLARPGWSAGLSVAAVVVLLLGPAAFVIGQIVGQLAAHADAVQARVIASAEKYPSMRPVVESLEAAQLPQEAQDALQSLASSVPSFLSGSLWATAQLLFTVFILFYLFRDWRLMLSWLKSILPLTAAEADRTFQRVEDTIFATLYGSLVVALVQGALGGLIFWLLGLPGALLWGVVMALLAVIPTLGTFVVWAPAALLLALDGEYFKAGALFAWGCLAIGLIDNFLYPLLVGKRLRLHPLLVFIAIVGGIVQFGMAGVVLGPVALSVTDALIEVWRRRTAHGATAETALEEDSPR